MLKDSIHFFKSSLYKYSPPSIFIDKFSIPLIDSDNFSFIFFISPLNFNCAEKFGVEPLNSA